MKFTVHRSKWVRGRGNAASAMLTPTYQMCCLGFLGKACGYTDNEMRNLGTPLQVMTFSSRKLFPENLVGGFGMPNYGKMIDVNDDPSITDEDREAQLKELFAGLGIEVTFED